VGSRKKSNGRKAVEAAAKRLPNVSMSRGAAITSAVTGTLVFAVAYVLGRRRTR
jgi:hypothetical protein